MSNSLITSNLIQLNNSYKIQSLGNKIARYRVGSSASTIHSYIITLTGTNYSNGTNQRRFLKAHLGRAYNGGYDLTEIHGNSNRFLGSTSAFNSNGIGICVETSSATELIIQIHNSGSNGPTSFFTSMIETFSGGGFVEIEAYTGGIYYSNPF
jgi:hypothetical protein